MTRTFFLENLGCAKNQVDAEIMIAALEATGWRRCAEAGEASVILVNTCGFIGPAKQESIDVALGFLSEYPEARVVLAGCLSQRYPDDLASGIPELAGVFGNRAPARIVELLDSIAAGTAPGLEDAQARDTGPRVLVPTVGRDGSPGLESHTRSSLLSLPGSAYVKVSEGCDNRCAFCAIPMIRGRSRSKPIEAVLGEIDALLDRGIREINLVAQDLAAYGRDQPGSSPQELLRAVSRRQGRFWVRLLYVYPDHFPDSFFPLLQADSRLLPYFDVPFQHASAAVLRRMGRPGSSQGYLELVRRIRAALPDAVIRSTFLVGFFGESEDDFRELLEFQQQAELDWLGVFPYSPEEGTPAMRGDPPLDVPPALASRRAAEVERRQREITHARMERFAGRELDVLVEELVPGEPLALGRCYAQAPEVDGSVVVNAPEGSLRPGAFTRCRIIRRNGLDLEAVPL